MSEQKKTGFAAKFVLFLIVMMFVGMLLPERSSNNNNNNKVEFNRIKAQVKAMRIIEDSLVDVDSKRDSKFGELFWDSDKKLYWIEHSFKSKNGFGGYVQSYMRFEFKESGEYVRYVDLLK